MRQGTSRRSEARTFLFEEQASRYDAVISDVFNGSNPGHMHSKEVFARLKDWLQPGGILVVNFVGFHRGPNSQVSHKVAATLRAVFGFARCYRDQAPEEEPDQAANLVCFASDAPFRFNVPQGGDFRSPVPLSSFWVMRQFQAWEVLRPGGGRSSMASGIIEDLGNELLDAGAQRQIELQLRAHAQTLIPRHVWQALGVKS